MRAADVERLYAEHAQQLFGFLVYRTGDRALAEDLLADTFEAAFKARRGFDRRRASERTWLYAIALNRLRDHARHRSAGARALERAVAGESSSAFATETDHVELRDALMRALATLGDSEREAVALRFGAGLTLEQIARAIGVPRTTVEARLYRALRKLRSELDSA